jgi:hypothetical protein
MMQNIDEEIINNIGNCPICLDIISDNVGLECLHSFCSKCINKWKEKSNKCPICRQEIYDNLRYPINVPSYLNYSNLNIHTYSYNLNRPNNHNTYSLNRPNYYYNNENNHNLNRANYNYIYEDNSENVLSQSQSQSLSRIQFRTLDVNDHSDFGRSTTVSIRRSGDLHWTPHLQNSNLNRHYL